MRAYLIDDTITRHLAATRDQARDAARDGAISLPPSHPDYPGDERVKFRRDDLQIIELDLNLDKDRLVALINHGPDALATDYAGATKRRAWELTNRGGLKLIADYREGA